MPKAIRSNPAPFKRALTDGLIAAPTAEIVPPQPAVHIDEEMSKPPDNVIIVDGVEYIRKLESGTKREAGVWKPAFLDHIAEGGLVKDAAKLAGITEVTVYKERRKNPQFAAQWEEAADVGTKALEEEAARRAYHGWEEPVFFKGEKCGTVRRYSDTLLIFLLKGRKPEMYRDPHEYRNGGALADSIKAAAAAVALLNELSNKGSVPQVLEVLSQSTEVPLVTESTIRSDNIRHVTESDDGSTSELPQGAKE